MVGRNREGEGLCEGNKEHLFNRIKNLKRNRPLQALRALLETSGLCPRTMRASQFDSGGMFTPADTSDMNSNQHGYFLFGW